MHSSKDAQTIVKLLVYAGAVVYTVVSIRCSLKSTLWKDRKIPM